MSISDFLSKHKPKIAAGASILGGVVATAAVGVGIVLMRPSPANTPEQGRLDRLEYIVSAPSKSEAPSVVILERNKATMGETRSIQHTIGYVGIDDYDRPIMTIAAPAGTRGRRFAFAIGDCLQTYEPGTGIWDSTWSPMYIAFATENSVALVGVQDPAVCNNIYGTFKLAEQLK